MSEEPTRDAQNRVEVEVLKRYGLRWAVLAAWADELHARGAAVPAAVAGQLEAGRIKISSGCFSSCEVGCDLTAIEAALVPADAAGATSNVGFWLELLGRAMEDDDALERLLRLPAIRVHYAGCGFGRCACGGEG
ncbi:MAG: hypothetical protein ACYDIE_05655 [Candidatus Krumholzibacteriia bacterium]